MADLTGVQATNMASSALVSASSAYNAYSNSKHSAKMAEIDWQMNKDAALASQKIDQYISSRNKIELLDASGAERIAIQTSEMEAKAEASVAFATFGMSGGSTQQVMHSISRDAARAESARLYELDSALFGNQMQSVGIDMRTNQAVGSAPIDSTSSALAIGAAGAGIAKSIYDISSNDLYKNIQT